MNLGYGPIQKYVVGNLDSRETDAGAIESRCNVSGLGTAEADLSAFDHIDISLEIINISRWGRRHICTNAHVGPIGAIGPINAIFSLGLRPNPSSFAHHTELSILGSVNKLQEVCIRPYMIGKSMSFTA